MKLEVRQVYIALHARQIVRAVSLEAAPGEVVGLIGPNGSGKSTLLRSVYRMLRPQAGVVRVGGEDVWQLSARQSAQRTAVVVQEPQHEFEFSVREVVQQGRNPHKGPAQADTAQDAQIVQAALARVGLLDKQHQPLGTLSGGEKQRVLVARALAQEPKLLVLDEPTNHLDIHYQLELLELIQTLGITSLLTLHDLNLAAAYCSRLYLLHQGQIVCSGRPEQVLTPERLRQVFQVEASLGRHPANGRLQLAFSPLTLEKTP